MTSEPEPKGTETVKEQGDQEYEDTLARGDKLPDVRKPDPGPPSASVLIAFAMVGMWALVNAAGAWPAVREVAPLLSVAYFLVLTTWAAQGRRKR